MKVKELFEDLKRFEVVFIEESKLLGEKRNHLLEKDEWDKIKKMVILENLK